MSRTFPKVKNTVVRAKFPMVSLPMVSLFHIWGYGIFIVLSLKCYQHCVILSSCPHLIFNSIFVTLSTSFVMFHLISISPLLIDYVSFHFLQFTVHLIHFSCHSLSYSHLPYLVALILNGHSTLLSVISSLELLSMTYECLEINF